jgi:hypothetical protein
MRPVFNGHLKHRGGSRNKKAGPSRSIRIRKELLYTRRSRFMKQPGIAAMGIPGGNARGAIEKP